mmetsp:Transcript_33937/g.25008  ORF Transcript_33937/g.25008 Transcript_33937/m.25008 type:complete len:146 (+) Transcript_33937:597-1034(+)
MVITNRYLKDKYSWSAVIHALLGFYITGLTLAYSFLALAELNWKVNDGFHTIAGVMVLASIILIAIGGVTLILAKKYAKWKTFFIYSISTLHKYGAALLLLFSQVVILTGVLKYDDKADRDPLKILGIVHIVAFCILLLALEIAH